MTERMSLAEVCARIQVAGHKISNDEKYLAELQAALDAIREDLYDALEELEDMQAELDEDAEL